MRDFYATSASVPLDQAEGLRQLFSGRAGRSRQVIALAANPHVAFNATVLDRAAATLSCLGRQVLVVDAALSAPAPHEMARLDLAAGVELMMPGVAYLPARGLPLQHVDTRGSAARFVEALFDAVPSADVVLLHAEAADLARMLSRRAARPLLMAADHPESLKHAYASCKLLMQRTGLATYDLLLAASARSPRILSIVASLRGCADSFLGAVLHDWALVDPALPAPPAGEEIRRERVDGLADERCEEPGYESGHESGHETGEPDGRRHDEAHDFARAERLGELLAAQLVLDDAPEAAPAPSAAALVPTPLHPGQMLPADR
ncbi:MAG: flagellar biosynthesis protein [Burkholderiales bacterium]|nr:flagellar biosynthesis protein [Burkholderiales bacterium]